MLLTDSKLPPELMPGIRDRDQDLTLDGLLERAQSANDAAMQLVMIPALAVTMFVPALTMRTARAKIDGAAYYHVMNRILERRYILKEDHVMNRI
jgi:hypothetical protein